MLQRIEELERQVEHLKGLNYDRQRDRDRLKKTLSILEKERKAEKKKVQKFIESIKKKLASLKNAPSATHSSTNYHDSAPTNYQEDDSQAVSGVLDDFPDPDPPAPKKKINKPKKDKKKKAAPTRAAPTTPVVDLDEVPLGGGNSSFGGYTFDENANPFGDAPPATLELIECDGCGRKFNEKALKVHKKICKKVFQTKRKVFKVVVCDEKPEPKKGKKGKKEEKKKDEIPKWKRDRDNLRAAMKMARKIKRAQARGEDISKIAFEATPAELDDRVPCPHCGRKFNENAANRHIPKCAQMQHNKPKPGKKKKKKR